MTDSYQEPYGDVISENILLKKVGSNSKVVVKIERVLLR